MMMLLFFKHRLSHIPTMNKFTEIIGTILDRVKLKKTFVA